MNITYGKNNDSKTLSVEDDEFSTKKKNVLIIEDSVAISVLIREFLIKIGYKKIHTSESGKTGIQIFQELSENDDSPIVLLDYELPDMNADEIMLNLYKIRPDAKIIIETAEERNSEKIKELLRKGAYLYLPKPIRFDDLKRAFNILENENSSFAKGSPDDLQKIESLLKSHAQISFARLSETLANDEEKIQNYLKDLEKNGRIVRIGNIKEVSCSVCGSIRIGQDFHCPSCKSEDFIQGKLFEHFTCGNVSLADSYINDKCPKCHKEIKIVGVDYRTIDNYYVCKKCGNKFPELASDYHCVGCNNKFKIEQAKWMTSDLFRVVKAEN